VQSLGRTLAQLVQRAVLDRFGRTCLRAGGHHAVARAVVAERALPDPSVVLDLALVEHTEWARGHAVATAVADVLLHEHRARLAVVHDNAPRGARPERMSHAAAFTSWM